MTTIDRDNAIKQARSIGMSFSSIARMLNTTIGVVSNVLRKKQRDHKREYAMRPKIDGERVTLGSYHVERAVYCPSVAYVKGLEEYKNPHYRMVVSNENTIHPMADNT